MSTLTTDSILTTCDTLTNEPITIQLDSLVTLYAPVERHDGDTYEQVPLNNSLVTPILLFLFIFLALSLNRGSNVFSKIILELFSVKKRRTDYDVKSIYDTYINFFLIFTSIATQGILLYFLLFEYGDMPRDYSFTLVVELTILAGGFLLFRVLVNRLIWYVFSDQECSQLAMEGLLSAQKILGVLLISPILIMILNPNLIGVMLVLSGLLYVASIGIFMAKVWRIFFANLYLLFYFILYLCSVEIVPLVNLYIGMFQLNRFSIF